MATTPEVPPSKVRSARRRRAWHTKRIAEAATKRDELWRVVHWLIAESRHQPEDKFSQVTADIRTMAERLNEEVSR